MSIKQKLDIKQGQTLAMTPQLQQAIKLLQMSNLELAAFVDAELEKNPLLERDDGSRDAQHTTDVDSGDTRTPDSDGEQALFTPEEAHRNLDHDFDHQFTGGRASDAQDYDAFSTNSFADVGKGGRTTFDASEYSFENTLADTQTLRDYLLEQIQVEFKEDQTRALAAFMLDFLDEAGYFRADIGEVATRMGTTNRLVLDVLERLQRLDPPGIFAQSLQDCLALQLREKNRLDPAMKKLLDHLDVLAKHDSQKLMAACGVNAEDLADMIAEVRALNPKPATDFDHFVSQTVIPDVFMRPLPKSRGGGWTVELNTDTLPRVLVNQTYHMEISKTATSKEDKEYLNTQLSTASWLVKAMDQRAQTILKTAGEIIKKQEAFFLYGVEYLKPMVLREVAQDIDMHESTVSRVTTNKYIGTPRGVFELKYFFSSGLSTSDGAASYAAEAIKARIKTMIDAETIENVLSDDDIAKALKAEGIDAARRTVAKYREAMKIGSSVQRRREKKKL